MPCSALLILQGVSIFSFHLATASSARLFRKNPTNCRDIVRSDVLVCLSDLLHGIGSFRHKIILYFGVCWSAVFMLPLPVPFAFDSSRTVVTLYLQEICFDHSLGFGYSLFRCRFRLHLQSKDAELFRCRRFGISLRLRDFSIFCYAYHSKIVVL